MGNTSPPKTKITETPLSKEQLSILRSRESFYNTYAAPALKEHFNQVQETELRDDYKTSPYMQLVSQQVGDVRDQFGYQRDQVSLNLAQRGLEGSGVEANTLGQMGAAEASAVGGTINQSQLQALMERNNITNQQNNNMLAKNQMSQSALQGLLSQAPHPSMASPTGMVTKPGKGSSIGATLMGGIQGAQIGGQAGPWGALAGGIIGGGVGYSTTT
jgi:hypothetical protein